MERESKARGERAGAETKSVCSYLHFIVRGAQITHIVYNARDDTKTRAGFVPTGVDTCKRERDAK